MFNKSALITDLLELYNAFCELICISVDQIKVNVKREHYSLLALFL